MADVRSTARHVKRSLLFALVDCFSLATRLAVQIHFISTTHLNIVFSSRAVSNEHAMIEHAASTNRKQTIGNQKGTTRRTDYFTTNLSPRRGFVTTGPSSNLPRKIIRTSDPRTNNDKTAYTIHVETPLTGDADGLATQRYSEDHEEPRIRHSEPASQWRRGQCNRPSRTRSPCRKSVLARAETPGQAEMRTGAGEVRRGRAGDRRWCPRLAARPRWKCAAVDWSGERRGRG